MHKIVVASDSFKDALDASQVCSAIAAGLQLANAQVQVIEVPLGDGGEGTARLLTKLLEADWISKEVSGPLKEKISASFGWKTEHQTAYLDMAQVAGLQLLKPHQRNPLHTSTYGLGQLLQEAWQLGARRIFLGLGGSATNDAGIGMAAALGYQFLDKAEQPLPPVGASLIHINRIQIPELEQQWWKSVEIIGLSDVNNPLYGPQGAATIFAAQKGADANGIQELDRGLQNLANIITRDLGMEVQQLEGAGAAGGLGAGLHAFLGAQLQSGIQSILKMIDFANIIADADLIITGEGQLDQQTSGGKLIHGICQAAQNAPVPVIALCGSLSASPRQIKEMGLQAAFSIINRPMDLMEALSETEELLQQTSFHLMNSLLIDNQSP